MSTVPQEVLSEHLKQAIGGRRVRSAIFTTFSFDPGFFELQILPGLFDQSFSQVDKIRRLQLEDALGAVNHVAVYYDSAALSQDGVPAQLDYRRIDVHRKTGCFHPKLVMLLVDEFPDEDDPQGDPPQALIIGTLSANLTRAGWWENVECAHFETLSDIETDDSRCSFRRDLLGLIKTVRDSAGPGEDHSALDAIHQFILERTRKDRITRASHGHYFTRLFYGQQRTSFPNWLADLRLDTQPWNLEILSPYFDTGAGALQQLVDVLDPRECRVALPRHPDGKARVNEDTYQAIGGLASWCDLPEELTARGRSAIAERMPPRTLHAKVYRLWSRRGRDLLIMGSVNLTTAGHSHRGAGNLEAAFLIDVTDAGYPRRWWLQPIDQEPERFAEEQPGEDEGVPRVPFDLALRFDWGTGALTYRLTEKSKEPFELCEMSGQLLFRIDRPRSGKWVQCEAKQAERLRELLTSTSFVTVRHTKGTWTLLVREENMAYRPSVLTRMTPEEILHYWALLTPDQRAGAIGVHLGHGSTLEGIPIGHPEQTARDTLFDRFAGIYHSFGCLRRHIDEALEEGRERDAEARLFGAKYDSLPSLLEKTLARDDGDPITSYVTFLCAQQVRDSIEQSHRDFFRTHKKNAGHLDSLLAKLPDVRTRVSSSDDNELAPFLNWYEPIFLRQLRPESEAP